MPDITLVAGNAPVNPDGEWMTVSEAVARTGKAERTIRRWIDDGSIEHKRQGGRLLVWLANVTRTIGTAPDIAVMQQLAVVERQAELLERLLEQASRQAQEQAAPLLEMIGKLQEENSAQAEEIGRLKAELGSALVIPANDRRSWWRRFWQLVSV